MTEDPQTGPLGRLRSGEVIAGVAGLALAVVLLVLPWFATGHGATATGWSAMAVLRFPVAITAIGGLALVTAQATRAAPALPVSLSIVVTVIGALTTVALVIRLPTAAGAPQAGAYVGLVCAVVLTGGAFASLREESGWTPGPEHPIPTILLDPPDSPAGGR